MLNIGLDFGTTTSILSYHDGHQLKSYKKGGAGGTPYIPSALSVEKEDGSIQIGNDARLNLGDDDYDVYTHFKMLLAEQNPQTLAERGYIRKTPDEAAKDYILSLISLYKKEENLKDDPKKLVITAPEIWVREGRHAAREALKGICLELGFPYKLLSEPVAASVYFAHRFETDYGRKFNGHVMVCDYGGGTLDMSLSQIEADKIQVLEGTGKGNARHSLGAAGVAYDEAVVKGLMNNGNLKDKAFYRNLREFEEQKIASGQNGKMAKSLEQYRKNPTLNKKIFMTADAPVTPKDLMDVFDSLIAPELDRALSEMDACLKKHQVDTKDSEHFRVVMAGGFSAFYPVQHQVRSFFNSKTDTDTRFESCFNLTDTALAISKGAALIANNFYAIHVTCPISVGIRFKNPNMEEEDVVCLKKGSPISECVKPVYRPEIFSVWSEQSLDSDSMTLFLDVSPNRRRYLNLQGRLRDFLPNPHPDNRWQIGFSADDDLVFTMHVKDRSEAVKHINLGNLEEKLGGLHVTER